MSLPAKPKATPKATEERLDQIRKEAESKSATPPAGESYYGLPALKPPVWTWEVPLYFFFGGIARVSACIGFVAQLFHADPALIHLCFWIGLIGAAICPALLIADLGR